MKIQPDSLPVPAETPGAAARPSPVQEAPARHARPAAVQGQPAAAARQAPAVAAPDVSFNMKRDQDGRIYYVVTNANTGEVIREVPSEEVRKVAEGIAAILKQARSQKQGKLDTKA